MAIPAACLPGASVEFGKIGDGELKASLCEFSLKLPSFPFPPAFSIKIPFPPPFPFPKFSFALSCDPSKPIDITAGIEFGGGRQACFETEAPEG